MLNIAPAPCPEADALFMHHASSRSQEPATYSDSRIPADQQAEYAEQGPLQIRVPRPSLLTCLHLRRRAIVAYTRALVCSCDSSQSHTIFAFVFTVDGDMVQTDPDDAGTMVVVVVVPQLCWLLIATSIHRPERSRRHSGPRVLMYGRNGAAGRSDNRSSSSCRTSVRRQIDAD